MNVICTMKDVSKLNLQHKMIEISIFVSAFPKDNLVVRQLHTIGLPIPDLTLQLARKSFRTFGYAAFEEELLNQRQIQKVRQTNDTNF